MVIVHSLLFIVLTPFCTRSDILILFIFHVRYMFITFTYQEDGLAITSRNVSSFPIESVHAASETPVYPVCSTEPNASFADHLASRRSKWECKNASTVHPRKKLYAKCMQVLLLSSGSFYRIPLRSNSRLKRVIEAAKYIPKHFATISPQHIPT